MIEDSQETREAIEKLLRRDGYRVDAVKGEDEAGERARWHRPDLILISLSGLSNEGINAAQRLRASAGLGEQTPAVIFSAPAIPDGTEQQVEGNIYLTAPDNFNQLRTLLARVLSKGSSGM